MSVDLAYIFLILYFACVEDLEKPHKTSHSSQNASSVFYINRKKLFRSDKR